MEYQNILVDKKEGIATITLNRPTVLNALSPKLVEELKVATDDIKRDHDVKILVVKGEGRAWSAGVDLKALNENIQGGQFASDQILTDGLAFIENLQTMPQVTIAMVNGFCYTGATEFMLAFDLIVAADEAMIGDTHTKWGIIPKWGMTQRLQQRVGLLKAMELSFTAKAVNGKEAERIGLVNKSVPLAELEKTVMDLAKQIMTNSPQTIDAVKELYYAGANPQIKEGLDAEQAMDIKITDREEFLRDFENKK
jgi:enoyl-CoA hydratase/carnithine racemase